ncbi:MAG: alkanesulfonate monooxygenase SsuD [Gammaproteobacteria bacterium]
MTGNHMTTPRRGIGLTPMETRRDIIVNMAILADELGYELFVVPEGWGFDSTVILTEIALKTQRIKLMAGILSIWGRTPATIAMNAATLADVSDGRYILGLGASTPALVEGFHDRVFHQPAKTLRTVTTAVRQLLAGERALLDNPTGSKALRLGQPARPELPIYIAAMGKRATHVAAELADGWFPIYVPRDRYPAKIDELLQVRKSTGQRPGEFTVLAFPGLAVNSDEGRAREVAATNLAWYLCAMGDVYAKFVSAQGYADEVAAVIAANPKPSPSRGVIPQDAQVLLDQLTVYGSPDKVREELLTWDEAADIPVLAIAPGLPWNEVKAIMLAGAPEAVAT